jgi:hypothetical protein
MGKQDLTLLLRKLPTVTHLSLLNFDPDVQLITNHFLHHFAETPHRNRDIFLAHLQVFKYEGWHSFAWKELADMCYSTSTPRKLASGNVASKHIPFFRRLELRLYLLYGSGLNHHPIDLDCISSFKLALDFGTMITIHSSIYKYDVGEWEMVDLLQFA